MATLEKIGLDALGQFYGKVAPSSYHASGKDKEGRQIWLSKSMLFKIADNPYQWRFGEGFKGSAAANFGSVADCLLLTPECFENEFIVSEFSDYKTKVAREWRDSQLGSGLTVLTSGEFEKAKAAVEIMKSVISGFGIELGVTHAAQVAMVTPIEASSGNEYYAKALMDFAPLEIGGDIIDLKTTAVDLNSDAKLKRQIFDFGYVEQLAFYSWIYKQIHGVRPKSCRLIFLSSSEPFIAREVVITIEELCWGLGRMKEKVNLYDDCITRNVFPGEVLEKMEGCLPEWAIGTRKRDWFSGKEGGVA